MTDSESQVSAEVSFGRDLVQGSLWSAIAAMIGAPVNLLISIFLARKLGVVELGDLASLVALFGLAAIIVNSGWSEATVQWLATASVLGNTADRVGLIRRCSGYHAYIEGPLLGLLAFGLLVRHNIALALAAMASAWVTQLLGTGLVVLTASGRNATSARLGLVVTLATQTAVALTAEKTAESSAVWVAQLACTMLGPILAIGRLSKLDRRSLLRPKVSFSTPTGFRTYAFSAGTASLLASVVFGRSEILVLRFDGYMNAAGLFVVITGLASQLTIPMDSLLAPLAPAAARFLARSPTLGGTAVLRSLRVSALLGALTACILVPIAGLLVAPVYGSRFSAASSYFVVLGSASCVQSILSCLTSFALATRRAGAVLRANLFSFLTDATLALLLIPPLGLAGAVIANACSQIMAVALLMRVIHTQLDISYGHILKALRIAIVGIMGGVGGAVPFLVFGINLPSVLVAMLGGVTLLRLVLWRFPSFRLDIADLSFIHGHIGKRLSVVFGLLTRLMQFNAA